MSRPARSWSRMNVPTASGVLLAEARVGDRVAERALTEVLGVPRGPRQRAGDRRRQGHRVGRFWHRGVRVSAPRTWLAVLTRPGRLRIRRSVQFNSAGDVEAYGESRLRGSRRDGQSDGGPPDGEGPHSHRLQPHEIEGGLADQERHGVRRHAEGRVPGGRLRVRDGDQLGVARSRGRTGPTACSPASRPGKVDHRHEHRQPRGEQSRWPRRSARRAPTWSMRPSPAAS